MKDSLVREPKTDHLHDGERIRFFNGYTEGFKINLSKGAVANDDIGGVLPVFLLVPDLAPRTMSIFLI